MDLRPGPRSAQRGGTSGAPLRVEVLAYAPTVFYHCTHCETVFQHAGLGRPIHAEQEQSALPDDLRHDYAALSQWIRRLVERECGRVEVKVVDAASLEGFWKILRYRARRLPALIMHGRAYALGHDLADAERLIAQALPPAGAAPDGPGAPEGPGAEQTAYGARAMPP